MKLYQNNDLGYYKVDGKIYFSKNLAFSECQMKNKKIEFFFNDDVFSRYDWTKEPEPGVSLNEFYRRRAQQIRDNYDYVILQYSGGPDSQNILNVFLNNKIKLDEIVNFNSYESTNVLEGTTHNADYFYNVKPFLEERLKENGSFSKITIIDEIEMTKKVLANYTSRDYFELLFSAGSSPSYWIQKGNWIKNVKHIWDKIISGQRVCVMLGADKTSIRLTNGKYSTTFSDIHCCDILDWVMNDNDLMGKNITEYFYHTPNFPEIMIKQAHLLKKKVENETDLECFDDINKFDNTTFRHAYMCQSKKFPNKILKYNLYHKILYPTVSLNIITPKPRFWGKRTSDCWWIDDLDEKYRKIWRLGAGKYLSTFSNLISTDAKDFSNLPILYSKRYYLE